MLLHVQSHDHAVLCMSAVPEVVSPQIAVGATLEVRDKFSVGIEDSLCRSLGICSRVTGFYRFDSICC